MSKWIAVCMYRIQKSLVYLIRKWKIWEKDFLSLSRFSFYFIMHKMNQNVKGWWKHHRKSHPFELIYDDRRKTPLSHTHTHTHTYVYSHLSVWESVEMGREFSLFILSNGMLDMSQIMRDVKWRDERWNYLLTRKKKI